jgi:hypothetical protein
MIIVTAADGRYFELAQDLILSIQACWSAPVPLGFVDLGLHPEQIDWLSRRNVAVVSPQTDLDLRDVGPPSPASMSLLVRPYLDTLFPGHDVYLWVDADIWLQTWEGMQSLYEEAAAKGACVVHEREKAYGYFPRYYGWQLKHLSQCSNLVAGVWMWLHPHVNAGVFALRADAPHWARWRIWFQKALNQSGRVAPHDQMAWNALVHLDRLPTVFAPTRFNWIISQGGAIWNSLTEQLCVPYPPYEPLATIHLAGADTKSRTFAIPTTDGLIRHMSARYRGLPGDRECGRRSGIFASDL